MIFQSIYKTITTFSGLKDTISEWESKRLSNEKFMCAYIANVNVCPKLVWMKNSRIRLKFKGSCQKQEDKAIFTHQNVVNLFIVYELDTWLRDLNTDFTLKDYLFGSVKLTKNADPDKHKYSCYGIAFDPRSEVSFTDGTMGKNTIFWS